MVRPRKKESRDRQFNIALTERELALLNASAASAAMRPADYARARLFTAPRGNAHGACAPHLDPLFLVALSRLGNNLNQLVRRIHTFEQPAPPSLEPLLRDIRALITKGGGE